MDSLRAVSAFTVALLASLGVAAPAHAVGAADCGRLVALGVSSTSITSDFYGGDTGDDDEREQ